MERTPARLALGLLTLDRALVRVPILVFDAALRLLLGCLTWLDRAGPGFTPGAFSGQTYGLRTEAFQLLLQLSVFLHHLLGEFANLLVVGLRSCHFVDLD